ncbi:hypothetical protein [Psychrobacter sp. LV10R520-6]|uniref:hypothetical protein n=1 Tax=Psychrobacter sp. LV10R520-6 TaxID=1415574 RepID=UPI0024CAD02D|nr:hypothetical protein [Psychrobacter sp. LV10R520-6]SNT71015.1 hypothetical protein SAMN04488491_2231 [Psychrobacter sp. LV10R520-6]
MKLSMFTGAMASILAVSGCTTDPMYQRTLQVQQPTWQKAGISKGDTNNAIQKCRYDIGMANISAERENTLLTACLESKGYRYTDRRVAGSQYL